MEIFGVGAAEILVIALLLLIVAGPKRSAEWAREAGRYVSQIRTIWQRMMQDLRNEIGDDADEIVKTAQQIRKTAFDVKKATSPKKIAETTVKLAEHVERKNRDVPTDATNGNGSTAPVTITDSERYSAWQPKSSEDEDDDE
jgi:Sec-independent protein translocase protein TatA